MIESAAIGFTLILTRTSTFVAVLPIFRGRNLPRLIKIGLAFSLASMWFGTYADTEVISLWESSVGSSWLSLSMAMIREGVFGAFWGFAFSLFLLPIQIAGSYVGQEMGLTLASISDPHTNRTANVVSQLFEALGTLLFFALDLHHVVFATLNLTFIRWPIGVPLGDYRASQLITGVANAHELGLLIAAPMGIALFMTLITLALLMKASPQLNLFSVGLTLRVGVGMCAMLIFLPEMTLLTSRILSRLSVFMGNLL